MRMYQTILAGASLTVSGCGAVDEADVQLEVRSTQRLDFIATSISQDWVRVFPRFFSADASDARKEFRTYNGTAVSISSEGNHRTIRIHAPSPLSRSRSLTQANARFPQNADFVHASQYK